MPCLPPMMLAAPLAIPLLLCGGCIAHTARVLPDPDAGPGERVVIGTRALPTPPAPMTVTRALPIELPLTAWEQRGGSILRRDEVIRTPLPWWQRFPCDIASDLIPTTSTAGVERTVSLVPPARLDDDALTQEARSHGFAHDRND